jgi:hypothetical protein
MARIATVFLALELKKLLDVSRKSPHTPSMIRASLKCCTLCGSNLNIDVFVVQ